MSYATPQQIIRAWKKQLDRAVEKGKFDEYDLRDARYFLNNVSDTYGKPLITGFYLSVRNNDPKLALSIAARIEKELVA